MLFAHQYRLDEMWHSQVIISLLSAFGHFTQLQESKAIVSEKAVRCPEDINLPQKGAYGIFLWGTDIEPFGDLETYNQEQDTALKDDFVATRMLVQELAYNMEHFELATNAAIVVFVDSTVSMDQRQVLQGDGAFILPVSRAAWQSGQQLEDDIDCTLNNHVHKPDNNTISERLTGFDNFVILDLDIYTSQRLYQVFADPVARPLLSSIELRRMPQKALVQNRRDSRLMSQSFAPRNLVGMQHVLATKKVSEACGHEKDNALILRLRKPSLGMFDYYSLFGSIPLEQYEMIDFCLM